MGKLFHWLEHILDTIYPIVMVIDTVSILFPLQAMKINEILFTLIFTLATIHDIVQQQYWKQV